MLQLSIYNEFDFKICTQNLFLWSFICVTLRQFVLFLFFSDDENDDDDKEWKFYSGKDEEKEQEQVTKVKSSFLV